MTVKKAAVAGLAVAVMGALPVSPAPAHAQTSVVIEGRCTQVGAFVPVPAGNVRDQVPERFAIPGEEAGVATVLVTIGHCEPWLLDGRPAKPLTFGLVCVVGAQPRDREDDEASLCYDLWWSFDRGEMTAAWRSLGIASETVPGIHLYAERGPAGGVSAVEALVPSGRSPFSLTAVAGGVPPIDIGAGEGYHWHEGPRGLVAGLHTQKEWHSPVEEQLHWNLTGGNETEALIVTIDTPDGSPLAHILGASTVTLPGASMEFPAFAVTALVGHDRRGGRATPARDPDGAAQHEAAADGFTIGFTCEETGAFLSVDAERVRRRLPPAFPDHFTLTEVGGQAVVAVISITCRDVTLDGRGDLAYDTNEAIVVIDPPPACHSTHNACEGGHHYLLWGPVSNRRLAARYRGLGAPNRPFVGADDNAVSITLGTATNTAEASLRGHYGLSAATAAAWATTPYRRQTEWQIGGRGLVADSFEVFDPEFWSAGNITIRPEPGSPLADLLGTDEPLTTAGVITQLRGTGTAELVPWPRQS